MDNRPKGQRFSLTYLQTGDPMNDSEPMRFRLAKLIGKDRYQLQGPPLGFAKHKGNLVPHHRHLQDLAEDEIGIEFNTRVDGKMRVSWVYFLQKLDIKHSSECDHHNIQRDGEVGPAR